MQAVEYGMSQGACSLIFTVFPSECSKKAFGLDVSNLDGNGLEVLVAGVHSAGSIAQIRNHAGSIPPTNIVSGNIVGNTLVGPGTLGQNLVDPVILDRRRIAVAVTMTIVSPTVVHPVVRNTFAHKDLNALCAASGVLEGLVQR